MKPGRPPEISDRELARQYRVAQGQGWTEAVLAAALGWTTQRLTRRLATLKKHGFELGPEPDVQE
jgi:hypothetical protein